MNECILTTPEQLHRRLAVLEKDVEAAIEHAPTVEKKMYQGLRSIIEDVELENCKLHDLHVHDVIQIRALKAQIALKESHFEILESNKKKIQEECEILRAQNAEAIRKERDQLQQELLKLKEMLARSESHEHNAN